jgi:rhodanese-related sulfurtransferase
VSQGLVVGIFPTSDSATIESALSAAQIDANKVKVIRLASAASPADESSELDFVDVVNNMESNSFSDDMTKGLGIMGDSGGTGVPMGRSSASLGSFNSRADSANYLSGLAIPSDEVDNFNGAIEAGRSVVAYPDAGADADKIASAFKSAGLRNVRVY